MQLNFIIFSNLDASNGGVETWLRLLIKEVNDNTQRAWFDAINIYYFTTPEKQVPLIESTTPGLINYFPIPISEKKGLFFNFLKLAAFHWNAVKQVKQNKQTQIFSIGSYPSGIFDWLCLRLMNYRKHVSHYIWLRTTLSKHIRTHNSRIVSRPIFFFEKRALQDADVVISNGWDTKENYIEEYNIPSTVIPNAIDPAKYAAVPPLRELNNNKIRIAFIGRFYESKGAFNFVNAIKIFNEKYPQLRENVTFVFVGWGEQSIEKFAADTQNCEFTGRVANDKMHELLGNIHAGVALTKAVNNQAGGSGISNNLLELMVAGRIILAYDNSIFRQFPRQDCMCYIKENDDDALADNYAGIVDSIQSYYSLGENAKAYSREFSISNHVSLLSQVIKSPNQ